MSKAVKWIGIGIGAIVAVVALVAVYIVSTFNPNDYKADIVRAMQEKTGRTLQLKGDLKLAFYPSIGAKIGEASLSEPKSDKEFASIKDALVSVKVMPLLGKQVVVDAIELKGLRANIRKEKTGKFNFDDLTGGEKKEKAPQPQAKTDVKIDIAHVDVSDAEVNYLNEADGIQHRLSNVNLKTGRIAPGTTTPVTFGATLTSGKRKVEVDTKLDLSMPEAKRFDIAKLTFKVKVTDPAIPKGSFDANISGSARADLAKENASLDFNGKLDESNVNGKAAVTKFTPLTLTFDFNADQLDLDRLLGKEHAAKPAEAKGAQSPAVARSAKDEKIDLSALHGVNASGNVKLGKLNAFNIKSSQLSTGIKLANGRLDVAPIAAQLYDGTMSGSLSAQAAAAPSFSIKQNLVGIAVGPLLRDAAQIDSLEGKGNVSVDVTTQGITVDALKKALGGTAAIVLADGAIKGMDIAGQIRSAQEKIQQLGGKQVQQQSNKSQKTDFSELKASFNIRSGVAHNDDLSMKSPLLRVGGSGNIDIGNDRLDYLLKPTLVASSQGQGGKERNDLTGVTVPVKLTGPIASPDWSIDFGSMLGDVAKSRVTDEIMKRIPGQAPAGKATDGKAPAKGGGGIGDQLKGIFGR